MITFKSSEMWGILIFSVSDFIKDKVDFYDLVVIVLKIIILGVRWSVDATKKN